jgi:GxxExxY protein
MDVENKNVLYPDLSYQIIGSCFDVFNSLGFGHKEIIYQQALASILKEKGIPHKREERIEVKGASNYKGLYVLDFLVDKKIILELKVAPKLGYTHIHQAIAYLTATNIDLAILVYFTKDGVKYRRILRPRE